MLFTAAMLLCAAAASARADSASVVTHVAADGDSAYVSGIKVEPADEEKPVKEKGYVYQGAYLSADLFDPLLTAFNGGRFQFEIQADVSLWHKLFPAIEYGMMFYDNSKTATDYKYSTNGFFVRAGAGYNVINNKPDRKYDHALIVGARYCVGSAWYQLSDAKVHENYWGTDDAVSSERLHAAMGWLEILLTVRVQLYKGLFMSLGVRVQTVPHLYNKDVNYPAYMPGFGTYSEGTTNWNYDLCISYRFPYKKNKPAGEND